MRSNFDACLKVVFEKEGGYVYNKNDPGSHTNMGITIYTLSDYRKQECRPEDVKNLTKDEAGAIYKEMYWDPLACDDLPLGVDLSVFDMGVNAGVLRGAKILQKIVATIPDGIIGSKTLLAVNEFCKANGTDELIKQYRDARLRFYNSLDTFSVFGGGWTNRANSVYIESVAMAQGK